MYITTSEMLEEERMQEILRADTKKERRLCLFCKKDDTFSFEDVAGLLPAAKKMEILCRGGSTPSGCHSVGPI